jgi:eukaryotic-like serine/threonine-protein kinase
VVERVERTPPPRAAAPPPAAYTYDDDGDQPRRRWPWVLLGLLLVMGALGGGGVAYLANRTATHEVPVLAGRSHDELRAVAAENRWVLPERPNFERDDAVPRDHVIRTDPPAGEKLAEGAELRYTISLGPTTVKLPAVANLPLAEARAKLEAVALVLAEPVVREHSETVPKDHVIRADTMATDIPKGEPVTLVVSDGPAPRTVPDGLEGQPFAAAQKSLTDLGLKPVRVDEFHDTVASGSVIKVTPGAGQQVPRDAEVTVAVSKGPAPRAVPKVAGKSVPEARDLLTAAGFVIDGVDGDPTKRVIDTDPPGGEVHPYGTKVRIIARRT